jgi:hypothetical protein
MRLGPCCGGLDMANAIAALAAPNLQKKPEKNSSFTKD